MFHYTKMELIEYDYSPTFLSKKKTLTEIEDIKQLDSMVKLIICILDNGEVPNQELRLFFKAKEGKELNYDNFGVAFSIIETTTTKTYAVHKKTTDENATNILKALFRIKRVSTYHWKVIWLSVFVPSITAIKK